MSKYINLILPFEYYYYKDMGETSPAKLWAILAPLAALAGLAWLHLQRRKVKGEGTYISILTYQ